MTPPLPPALPLIGCLALLMVASMPPIPPAPAQAQTLQELAFQRGRAANLARMRAEVLNGGLGEYHTEACMHELSGGRCLIRSSPEGFLFRFLGGPPGWQHLSQPPTRETEILIASDGRRVVSVLYNGPPR